MVRIIVVIVIAVVALWFLLHDGKPPAKIAEQEIETMEDAKAGVAATEKMATEMAGQSDAIRDEAMGGLNQPAAGDEAAQQ